MIMNNTFETAAELGLTKFATRGAWFRITGSRGNAKGHTGKFGQLMWLGIEGNPKAWTSSPDAMRITRIGLKIEGRDGYLFLAPQHVVAVDRPTTDAELISIEVACHAFASIGAW